MEKNELAYKSHPSSPKEAKDSIHLSSIDTKLTTLIPTYLAT